MFNKIKWAYQRVVRGYDDRIYWGFSEHFKVIIPAIEDFCKYKLDDNEYIKLNPDRCEIYTKTLQLINEFKEQDYEDDFEHPNSESRLWSYFGDKIGWFWD